MDLRKKRNLVERTAEGRIPRDLRVGLYFCMFAMALAVCIYAVC